MFNATTLRTLGNSPESPHTVDGLTENWHWSWVLLSNALWLLHFKSIEEVCPNWVCHYFVFLGRAAMTHTLSICMCYHMSVCNKDQDEDKDCDVLVIDITFRASLFRPASWKSKEQVNPRTITEAFVELPFSVLYNMQHNTWAAELTVAWNALFMLNVVDNDVYMVSPHTPWSLSKPVVYSWLCYSNWDVKPCAEWDLRPEV